MSYIANETTKFIEAIFSMYSDKNTLLNELIYGKELMYYDIDLGGKYQIWLYLHENNPEILICLSNMNRRFIFDVRRVHLTRTNYRYELDYQLKDSSYIVAEDFDEEIILIFNSSEERENFYRMMKAVSIYLANLPSELDSAILKNFIRADINQNLQISIQELEQLMSEIKLNLGPSLKEILLQIQDGKVCKSLNYRQFQKFAKIIDCQKELLPLFESYAKAKINSYKVLLEKTMSWEEFESFLINEQAEPPRNISTIKEKYFHTHNTRISFFQFCNFLNSPLNSAISPSYELDKTDTSKPLVSYYCYSSHNTYLTGNQLTSDSKVERYLEDLEDGIRCVQIDVHDGYGGPIVKHGYTATASVKFEEVIKEIARFHRENIIHTPIILSIENHCGSEYQYEMAKIMEKQFQSSIIHINDYEPNHFLTLQECVGKIIIKCSGNLKFFNEAIGILEHEDMQEKQPSQMKQSSDEEDIPAENLINASGLVLQELETAAFQKKRQAFEHKFHLLQERKEAFIGKRKAVQKFMKASFKTKTHSKSKKLLNFRLLTITSMLGNGKLGYPSPWESISLNETKIEESFQKQKQHQIQKHTKTGWIRVYPKGSRFDSSNYDPLPSFEVGAQIIALNTQNADHCTHLMKKYFMKGSKVTAGYRLKPNFSEHNELKFKKITPISASKIYFDDQEKKNETPICQIKMRFFGLSKDLQYNTEEAKWKPYTEAISDNAYHPLFERRGTITVRYHCEEMAFIGIEIEECGVGILPLDSVRNGYRSVFLYDEELKVKASRVLCLIE